MRQRLLAGRFRRFSTTWAPQTNDEARVLICLWNRPARIHDILTMLDGQEFAAGVRLYLWNNKREHLRTYRKAIAEFAPVGSLRGVELAQSPYNVGSIGRFYWARLIARRYPGGPVIILDDDQDVESTFVDRAIGSYDPQSVTAWWAWTIVGDRYWERREAGPHDVVDHIGPGGSVMPSTIFADDSFFTGIPDRFGLLDDIWLSYFAKTHGLSLAKLDLRIEFVMDETNQFHGQIDIKPAFYDYLYNNAEA